ncbi:LOW QUALITY PROTEIN: hypothetical protein HID58_056454, partial [Brassica napus]
AIERSKSIGSELVDAIKGSRIAIVLLSMNYTSSTWCLNELVEIIKSLVKQSRLVNLGKSLKKLVKEKQRMRSEDGNVDGILSVKCLRWKRALTEVAQIAGFHSTNGKTEAEMIEVIATDVSNKLNLSAPCSDFDGLVGMESKMTEMRSLLQLDSNVVRKIGILGPSGIDNIKRNYAIPACSDDYSVKLNLQKHFMSQLTNETYTIVKDRLKDKKVLVVLDDVDRSVQLEAMAKETSWFGPGSRIIITTQDQKVLKASGINHIHKVNLPSDDEALQMFCMYAFDQKYPKDGFEELAWKVRDLVGRLPLGLKVIGSYFRGMSEQEWIKTLPKLRTHLDRDREISSILKFSYDALHDEEKSLFLHIACFFNDEPVDIVEGCLAKCFLDVTQGIRVLVEKSLISIEEERIKMSKLLVQLGRQIVQNESVSEPGKRQFLNDASDSGEVLSDDKAGNSSVIGINLEPDDEITWTSERAFERLSNLQFLRILGKCVEPQSMNYLSQKLRVLIWRNFKITCFPSSFNPKFLVKLEMHSSKLVKFWEGIKLDSNEVRKIGILGPLGIGKTTIARYLFNQHSQDFQLSVFMDNIRRNYPAAAACSDGYSTSIGAKGYGIIFSGNVRARLDRGTTEGRSSVVGRDLDEKITCASERAFIRLSNLQFLRTKRDGVNLQSMNYISRKLRVLSWPMFHRTCFPSSFNPTFEAKLEMPFSKLEKLWGETKPLNLKWMELSYSNCLKELPDFSTATNLYELDLTHSSSLVKLSSSIGDAINLQNLNLSHCSDLVEIPSSIITNLKSLDFYGYSSLVEVPFNIEEVIDSIYINLSYCSSMVEVPSSTENAINLQELNLNDCSSLVEFPFSIGNAFYLQKLNMIWWNSLPLLAIQLINFERRDLNHCRVELPSSMRKLGGLSELELKECSKLEVLLASINLESLGEVNLSDWSLLKNYPENSTDVQETDPWIGRISGLRKLVQSGMEKLESLPPLPDSLWALDAENGESLERLGSSFRNPDINLSFLNYFKQNQEEKDLIIQTPSNEYAVFPGEEMPQCFTYRSSGSSLTVKLNQTPLGTSTKFKACIVCAGEDEKGFTEWERASVCCSITTSGGISLSSCLKTIEQFLPGHLYTFEFEVETDEVTSTELVFECEVDYADLIKKGKTLEIKECGIMLVNMIESFGDDNSSGAIDGARGFEASNTISIVMNLKQTLKIEQCTHHTLHVHTVMVVDPELIEYIATDVSNKLNLSAPCSDFDGLVGMKSRMAEMRRVLQLDSDEVRKIGILGPPGIGKTTIARSIFNRYSQDFQLSVFMDNIKKKYVIMACSDDYSVKLDLQKHKSGLIMMSTLLFQLGRQIVQKESISEPGKRQFLNDAIDIGEVLSDDKAGNSSVIGIDLEWNKDITWTSERAFERLSNLQFIRILGKGVNPLSMNYISRKLKVLIWPMFPMPCFPSRFNPEFLVNLFVRNSNLEKLWEENKPLKNIKWMDLALSRRLKELPDLSTAINLYYLDLSYCSSLVKLPSSIGNATNLEKLSLNYCSSLVKLPSSIGNAINLKTLSLKGCSSMVKLPSSIWNIVNLEELNLENCSNLVEIPSLLRSEIEKCTKSDCSRGSGKIINRLPIIAGLLSNPQFEKNNTIKYSESSTNIEELDPWIGRILRLRRLVLSGMRKLVSLPQLPDSLLELDAENCESLERLHCSFPNQDIRLNFANCFKLNQEARDLIIQMPTNKYAVFPTENVPICFSYRSSGSSLTVKLNRLPVGKSTKFKACILCAYDDENNFGLWETASVFCTITFGGNASIACNKRVERVLPGNLCTFEVEVETEEVPFEDFESSDIELVREDDELLIIHLFRKTEAEMVEDIGTDVSYKLNNSAPSSDFDSIVVMESLMTEMGPLLRLDSDEVRKIGILGPPGIGKTTIARYIFNKYSRDFQLSVFMDNSKRKYVIPTCSDDYSKHPKDGFIDLALEVMSLVGELPLGLRVMGSYFRGMSEQDWTKALPKLRTHLDRDGEIALILKFSYDALNDEDKRLFPVFFVEERVDIVESCLAYSFLDMTQALRMSELLVQLGRKMVREQSVSEPSKRQFLHNKFDFGEVLGNYKDGSSSVIGIDLKEDEDITCTKPLIKRLSNLQFLRINSKGINPQSMNYGTMPCFPSRCNPKFLVKLEMAYSKLEKLWEESKPLSNLKFMDLSFSERLEELPDLSTATNLYDVDLTNCSSLVKLPSSIGNSTKLNKLNLMNCSSLVEILSSITTITSLKSLDLCGCSSLVEIPFNMDIDLGYCSSLVKLSSSIGNTFHLQKLDLSDCSSLVELPLSIGNTTNLQELNLNHCSNLMELPSSMKKLCRLSLLELKKCSKLEVVLANINLASLRELDLSDCYLLKSYPESSPNIQELDPWIGRISRLRRLELSGIRKLVSLPPLPDSLLVLNEDYEP